jgi:hypothetical protein
VVGWARDTRRGLPWETGSAISMLMFNGTSIMSTWDKTVVGVEESSVASDSRAESDPSASFESMMHSNSKKRTVISKLIGARQQEDVAYKIYIQITFM